MPFAGDGPGPLRRPLTLVLSSAQEVDWVGKGGRGSFSGTRNGRSSDGAVESRAVSSPAKAPRSFDPASLVGTVLDGRYELVAHLASGGMGAVFRARHVHLRKDVAVKVLRPELSAAAELVERFRREAEIASALEHDNLVRVTDFGKSERGLLFLVMDLLKGENLFEVLRRERVLPPARAVGLLWQICAGLEAAHELGVVHRDLKPENVFLARTASGREVVKLLDFGIAKFARGVGDSGTQSGIVVGTPEYLSPEQALGLPVDARADLYAVGIIAFRLLTGRHPFRADDARGLLLKQASAPVPPLAEANPELAAFPALCAAVAGACEKERNRRPASAAALAEQLAAALGPTFVLPPGATPVGPPAAIETVSLRSTLATPLATRRSRRRTVLLLGGGIALAAALGLCALAAVHARRGGPLARAEALLAAGKPEEALASIDAARKLHPDEPRLACLRARALRRIPGKRGEALDAYASAQASHSLEAEDYAELAGYLGDERALSDRAARVLRQSPLAVPAVAAQARSGTATQRMRAMAVLRDLGAEDAVDRVAIYSALLGDADCEVRRAAARRLGELLDPAALPALKTAAGATRSEKRWFISVKVPACGSAEAAEALRRIQTAH